jgi:hypothetical protein
MNQERSYEKSRVVAREYCVVASFEEAVSSNNVILPAEVEGNK